MRKTFKRPRDILEFDASNAFCISKDDSFPRYNTVYLTKAGEAVIDNVPECNNGPTNIGSFISSMILHVLSISTIVGSKEKEDSSKEEWFLENNGINLFDITASKKDFIKDIKIVFDLKISDGKRSPLTR